MQQEIFSPSERRLGGQLLRDKKVRILQFVEGTYQFEVKDIGKKAVFFPFIHIDDEGKIIDCFCTCPIVEKKPYCPHLAAAYLRIFQHSSEAFHVRFEKSLWNRLCFLTGSRHHFAPEDMHALAGGGWQTISQTGKILFSVAPRNPEGKKLLKEMVQKGPETEQTSIKFSNLSPEDLALWRQGRPSQFVLYRLSFWSDLASWLFMMQEEGVRYRLHFIDQKNDLPKGIRVVFPSVEVTFFLSPSNWPQVVPALRTVESPLKITDSQYPPIVAIRYDEVNECLIIQHKDEPSLRKTPAKKRRASREVPKEKKKPQPIIEIEDWFFLPGTGFFPLVHDSALGLSVIEREDIADFIDNHRDLVAQVFKTPIDFRLHPLHYHLSFIGKGPSAGLKITAYLFEPGDLELEGIVRFRTWLYIPGKGFLRTQNLLFQQVTTLIPLSSLTSFVERHRLWLNNYEGFQVHLATVESAMHLSLDEHESLHFEMRVEEGHEAEGFIDIGDWIYVPTRGFYPKAKNQGYLRPGLVVPASKIAQFIKKNREELESIKGFFSTQNPLAEAGLVIFFDAKERIVIKPLYQLAPSYGRAQVHLLGEVTYVEGEGFFELPLPLIIPPEYRKKQTISSKQQEKFITQELELLRSYCIEIDDRLVPPERLRLCMQDIQLSSRHGVWKVQLVYTSELGEVSLREVLEAYRAKRPYLCTAAGLLHLQKLQFAWLEELDAKIETVEDQFILSSLDCMKLLAFEKVVDASGTPLTVEAWFAQTDALMGSKPLSLTGLKSSLRPYQQFGVQWLWQLYLRGLSGLLCDEMGLGKTHQAMALIAALHNQTKNLRAHPILVVCPTSVIFHWEEILKRFLPGVRVGVYYGVGRSLTALRKEADVILTSYGILRSEKKTAARCCLFFGCI